MIKIVIINSAEKGISEFIQPLKKILREKESYSE